MPLHTHPLPMLGCPLGKNLTEGLERNRDITSAITGCAPKSQQRCVFCFSMMTHDGRRGFSSNESSTGWP
ncbi:hypothetical protein CGRA01v4_09094 [Colletotrichum graminicola]|nr:hypothetical protein CGRA01v4_09094 [Colletotrichum graminicola]